MNIKTFIASCSFLALLYNTGANASSAQSLIVNGDDADITNRPFQVSLQTRSGSQHFCGGALIGRNWILTAAHCVNAVYGPTAIKVVGGVSSLSDEEAVSMRATKFFVHPEFKQVVDEAGNLVEVANDIALIRIKDPAPADLLALPLADEELMLDWSQAGSEATVSGWGVTDPQREGPTSDVLQQLDLRIENEEECGSIFGNLFDSSKLCATSVVAGGSACAGDSGGSLTVDVHGTAHSIGVASFTSSVCGDSPSVFTRTASYNSWIKEVLNYPSREQCTWRKFTGSGGQGWRVESSNAVGNCVHASRNEYYEFTSGIGFRRVKVEYF